MDCIDPDIADLLRVFLPSREVLVSELRAAVASNDEVRARAICHKLKGSFGLYGVTSIVKQFSSLSEGYSDLSQKEMFEMIDGVETKIAALKKILAAWRCSGSYS